MTMHPHGTTLIDAAVAKIVGLAGMIDNGNVFQTGMNTHDEWLNGSVRSTALDFPMEWNPSGDMRYAMEASEKFGLFKFSRYKDNDNAIIFRGSYLNSEAWYVSRSLYIDDVIAQGDTLPLAICHAIIADYKKKNPTST
jgi:hypothetical protein